MKKHSDLGITNMQDLSQSTVEALESRSQTLLHQIWSEQSPDLSSLADSSTLFMLVGQIVHLFGVDELSEALAKRQWLFGLFNLSDESCQMQGYEDGTAVVTASFSATLQHSPTDEASFWVFCSLVWNLNEAPDANARLTLCQMTITEASPGIQQSVSRGIPTQLTAREVPETPPLALHSSDRRSSTHWVIPDQILYVAAAHQYTNIYCIDRLVRIRAPFAKVVEQLDGIVVPVHRSYAVNPAHVSRLEEDELQLSNGAKVPVPAKRVREIRELLSRSSTAIGAGD